LFEIVEIGFDAREATEIVQNLQDQDGFQMVEVAQTFTNLSAPTKDLISRVNAGTFHHFANPVLRWAASNCAVHFQGRVPVGEDISEHLDKVPIMPSKQRSADKIDPITAAVIAMSRLMAHPDDHGSSIYEQQGLMVI
jgi:phage terminase large subunit-like protein